MPIKATELELDREFWSALVASPAFCEWLLQRTKFWPRELELVTNEKWHQRWYRDPESGKDSETDILLMWSDPQLGDRVAIHIENKPAHRKWEPAQVENYLRRAENRKAAWRYADFQIVLLAPIEFILRHTDEAAGFDFVLTYEEISAFAPAFSAAIPSGAVSLEPIEVLKVELLRHSMEPNVIGRQPWLAEVRRGQFESIPEELGWGISAPLAHMIKGYEVFDDVVRLANERLETARQTGQWQGNSLELWGCLFAEHRRARHTGYGPADHELDLYDALCRTLRAKLVAANEKTIATIVSPT